MQGKVTGYMFAIAIAFCVVTLLLSAKPCRADQSLDELMIYTPTGDAFFDKVGEAILAEFDKMSWEDELYYYYTYYDAPIPLSLLDEWEQEFGNDPRYWQLRYWDAKHRNQPFEDYEIDPSTYLQKGLEIDSSDKTTIMLLYVEKLRKLDENYQEMFDAVRDTLPETDKAIPDGAASLKWQADETLAMACELTESCPDESWAWYQRAMAEFEFGEWEDGLASLDRGNDAENNRIPLPFPASYVNSRVLNEEHCGNDFVGSVASNHWSEYQAFSLNELIDNQLVRSRLGSQSSELDSWHEYICRTCLAEGSGSSNWLALTYLETKFLEFLFVEHGDSLSKDQREDIWQLNRAIRAIFMNSMLHHAVDRGPEHYDFIHDNMAMKYGYDWTTDIDLTREYVQTEKGHKHIMEEIFRTGCLDFEAYTDEQAITGEGIRKKVRRMLGFSYETLSWSEGE